MGNFTAEESTTFFKDILEIGGPKTEATPCFMLTLKPPSNHSSQADSLLFTELPFGEHKSSCTEATESTLP